MTIKNVKVTMSKVGVHTHNEPRKVMYLPLATITYNESEKTHKHYLDGKLVKKDYFKGFIIGKTYFAGITENEYLIYDEVGERTGSVTMEAVGKVIQANEDYFVCLKEKTIYGIDAKGTITASRELTDEELERLVG